MVQLAQLAFDLLLSEALAHDNYLPKVATNETFVAGPRSR